MTSDKEDRKTEKAWMEADRELEHAIQKRVRAGNELAVAALRKLVRWVPECGFPENVLPTYFDADRKDYDVEDYRLEQGLDDPELRFCTEAYTYELWGKEDARSFLAHLGAIARALGLEGLHDRKLR